MAEPPINRLRLDYEVKINRLQNSLIVRALLPIQPTEFYSNEVVQ